MGKYCQAAGLELSLSEMRWGINGKLSADHKTSETCMRELYRCKHDSVAVNFVGLLGSKYGYRPFPSEIKAELFNKLAKNCPGDANIKLLREWFQLDENSSGEPHFVLKPIHKQHNQYCHKQEQITPQLQTLQQLMQW